MIVATSALHSERHRSTCHSINAIIDYVMRHTDEPSSAGDESHRSEIGRSGRHELVRGDLEQEKLIVRQILVECPDHPIAISRRVDKSPFLARVNVSLRVRIARHIQPVATPSLTITGTGKQS